MRDSQALSQPDSGQGGLAVLFVDDEPTSRKLFARNFGDEFSIVTAASASDALDLLARHEQEFAVLLTDYRMPERDGMKLLQTVRREHRHLVRLLATAYAEKEVAIAAVN
ncbi:MAG: hybrid sensor histidine kinase/response regulator, partial [Ramlibacter sp.]|nr:hybrid sensor histidine kinase/response regulator [Ramlibacter sp.]